LRFLGGGALVSPAPAGKKKFKKKIGGGALVCPAPAEKRGKNEKKTKKN
jgi:hypothetical protein